MNPILITGAFELGKKLLDIGDQFIEDKDKKAEYAFTIAKLSQEFSNTILTTTTNPKVDALVKVMYAMRDVIIPLFRPLGAALITAFGLYAHNKGIEIDPVIHGTLDAAFPGWMTGRQVHKSQEIKAKATIDMIKAPRNPSEFTEGTFDTRP